MELLPCIPYFGLDDDLLDDDQGQLEFPPTLDYFGSSKLFDCDLPAAHGAITPSGGGILPDSGRSLAFDGDSPADSGPPSDIPVDVPTTSVAAVQVNPKKIRPEFCAVCGDIASGYHYEVPSCNGCKTFFRRTVLQELKYACRNKGACAKKFSKKLRIQCRSCRYDLCVSAGMNPFAMFADIHAQQNPVVKNILSKRKLEIARVEERRGHTRDAKVIFHLTPSVENSVGRLVEQLLYLEAKADMFRRSSYNPAHHFIRLDEVLLGHSKFGQKYSEVDYHSVVFPLPCTDDAEHPQLPSPAYLMKKDNARCGDRSRQAKMWRIVDAICIIEYLKTLEFFHRLSNADKKVLIKGVLFPCKFLMSSFYSYSRNSDVIFFPDGTGLPFGTCPSIGCAAPIAAHSFMVSHGLIQLLAAMQMDRREYVLFKALVVCNQSLCDLSREAKQILSIERQKYATSLFRHLMTHRGAKEGPKAYVELMTMVGTLTRMDEDIKAAHLLTTLTGSMHFPQPLIDDLCN